MLKELGMQPKGSNIEGVSLDGEPGPALPITAGSAKRLVSQAVAAAQPVSPKRFPLGAVAALLLVFIGVPATAAFVRYVVQAPPKIAKKPKKIRAQPQEKEVIKTTETPTPAPPQIVTAKPSRKKRRLKKRSRAAEVVSPSVAPSPEVLLKRAGRLRARRAWREAAEAYEMIVQKYPGHDVGYVASIAAAQIRLDHLDQLDKAIAGFDWALLHHPKAALSVEARWGRARAFRQKGDLQEEQTALKQLLAHHPNSTYADRARQRLKAL